MRALRPIVCSWNAPSSSNPSPDVTGVRATSGESGGRGTVVCRLCDSGALKGACQGAGQGCRAPKLRMRAAAAPLRSVAGNRSSAPKLLFAPHLRLPHNPTLPVCLSIACAAGKYVERVALPYVFKYLVSELAAMNIRCSLDIK